MLAKTYEQIDKILEFLKKDYRKLFDRSSLCNIEDQIKQISRAALTLCKEGSQIKNTDLEALLQRLSLLHHTIFTIKERLKTENRSTHNNSRANLFMKEKT